MKRFSLALAVCLLASALFAAKRQHDWRAGTVEASGEQREVAGSHTMGSAPASDVPYAPPIDMSIGRTLYRTWLGYAIHTDTMDYLVKYLLRTERQRRPNVTAHGPILFAVEGTKLYLRDEDAKEFEMIVMEKRLVQLAK